VRRSVLLFGGKKYTYMRIVSGKIFSMSCREDTAIFMRLIGETAASQHTIFLKKATACLIKNYTQWEFLISKYIIKIILVNQDNLVFFYFSTLFIILLMAHSICQDF
jgi:hypothetical protein